MSKHSKGSGYYRADKMHEIVQRLVAEKTAKLEAENADLKRQIANLKKHIEDDRYCAEHGQMGCVGCEDRCESCGYDALPEDMVTTEDGERLCRDCKAVDDEDDIQSDDPIDRSFSQIALQCGDE